MMFGLNRGFGIPFYLNGNLEGWVCKSLLGTFLISSPKMNPHDFYLENRYTTLSAAKLAIMVWFGE